MTFIGKLLKSSIKINRKLSSNSKSMQMLQEQTLRKLLRTAVRTEFGKHYHFDAILRAPNIIEAYKKQVPFFDYNQIHQAWWHRLPKGESNVTWPGKIKTFALSSGTTGSSSKQIPLSNDMLMSIRKASFKHLCSLPDFDLPNDFYNKEILMLGGSTHLQQIDASSMGDLSGILTGNLPNWTNKFYKPGNKIAKEKDWNKKLDLITAAADQWDIAVIAGVPAWIQILLERIISHYQVDSIHDIWPNLIFYVHGGVSMQPYKAYFKTLLGREIMYLETYLASEGFIAFEKLNDIGAMNLVMNNGIYYEFIPFDSNNFSSEGELLTTAQALGFNEVKENIDYALVLSTNAGAWRYLIGDTIKFTNLEKHEMVITGRIKHFLSLCGEHLSVDNMNEAIEQLDQTLNLNIKEFTVSGDTVDNYFSHTWWIGADNPVNDNCVSQKLDDILCVLNDDYKTERTAALKEIKVNIVPNDLFYQWMASKNKLGGSHKFPRVLNADQKTSWKIFLEKNRVENYF